jgi:hypothetical protein
MTRRITRRFFVRDELIRFIAFQGLDIKLTYRFALLKLHTTISRETNHLPEPDVSSLIGDSAFRAGVSISLGVTCSFHARLCMTILQSTFLNMVNSVWQTGTMPSCTEQIHVRVYSQTKKKTMSNSRWTKRWSGL